MAKKNTTIQISFELKDRLVSLGKKNESYEKIIWRLIEKVEVKDNE